MVHSTEIIIPEGPHLWLRWKSYLARWLAFGIIVSVFQPVEDPQAVFWIQKAYQGLWGGAFGLACGLFFTPLENKFNSDHVAWKTWALAGITWLVIKVVFVSTLALL